MARASSSSSCSSSTRLLLIAAACAVLALAWAPGVRATGVEDRDPGVAQKDALEMHPTLMLEELPHSGSGGGVAGGVRKLLGWSKKKYVVSWGSDGYGNYNKGYMQCQPPYKWAKVSRAVEAHKQAQEDIVGGGGDQGGRRRRWRLCSSRTPRTGSGRFLPARSLRAHAGSTGCHHRPNIIIRSLQIV